MNRSAPTLRTGLDLAAALKAIERRYRSEAALAMDPISIPKTFADPWDQEAAAWVAAHLAYGRVAPMLRAIQTLLAPLGPRPALTLRERSEQDLKYLLQEQLKSWRWRFHTPDDMIHWLLAWKRLDAESSQGGLAPHLVPEGGQSADACLSALVQRLRQELPATHGIRFLLPDPLEGAACKRWRLFLRWMARKAWPDLGLWPAYPPGDLIIPLDTHVARIARHLALTDRRTQDAAQARQITDALRHLAPEDPLRFDFAISHLGILGDCPTTPRAASCASCPLSPHCVIGRSIPLA